jgi:hypothetical protein
MYLPAQGLITTSTTSKGMGDCGCGCGGHGGPGSCKDPGLGDYIRSVPALWATGPARFGLGQDQSITVSASPVGPLGGLFSSTDISTWTWEWGVLLVGGYFLIKVLGDVGKVRRKVSRGSKKARKKRAALAKAEAL